MMREAKAELHTWRVQTGAAAISVEVLLLSPALRESDGLYVHQSWVTPSVRDSLYSWSTWFGVFQPRAPCGRSSL